MAFGSASTPVLTPLPNPPPRVLVVVPCAAGLARSIAGRRVSCADSGKSSEHARKEKACALRAAPLVEAPLVGAPRLARASAFLYHIGSGQVVT